MSWSNPRSSVFERLKIVTCDPSAEKTCPISTAMNPPPMMPSRFGSSGSRMIESDVWKPVSIESGDRRHDRSRPGGEQDVRCGDAPALDVEGVLVDEVGGPLDQRDVRRSGRPVVAPARRDRVDQTEHPVADRRPVGAVEPCVDAELRRRPSATATSAGYTNIFDGMHPRFRQVPPNTSRSTMAILQSSRYDGIEFPDPLPTMIRSNDSGRVGLGCSRRASQPSRHPIASRDGCGRHSRVGDLPLAKWSPSGRVACWNDGQVTGSCGAATATCAGASTARPAWCSSCATRTANRW